MDILNDFGIDPYDYLGVNVTASSKQVKKAYKTKAKLLHPDKTGGRTEMEFKLLHISYKHIIQHCVDKEVSNFEELKNAPREEEGYARSFYNTDFDDPTTRNELFADDDLNLEQFEEEMKRVQGGSTSYSAENFYRKEVLDTMKTKGKFDREKFNAFFLKLQIDGKIPNQLVKREKVVASNQDKEYVNVNVYCDKMVNSIDRTDSNYKTLLKQPEIKSDDITKLIDTDTKVIDSLIKQHRKDTGKISRKKLRELQMKAQENVPVNTQLTFEQAKERMLLEQLRDIQDSQKEQKEYVTKNKRIFANSIIYR